MIPQLTYEYISSLADLTWRDVAYGLDRQIIAPGIAIEHAKRKVKFSSPMIAEEEELANLSVDEPIRGKVLRLADLEGAVSEQFVRAKWLYVLLAWLYENRDRTPDPLSIVEELYCEFQYPKEISAFVRYMPMVGENLCSPEANERRMLESWRTYLNQEARKFGGDRKRTPVF